MTIPTYVFPSVTIILICALVYLAYKYWKLKKQYTRERFAFTAFFTLTSLASLFLYTNSTPTVFTVIQQTFHTGQNTQAHVTIAFIFIFISLLVFAQIIYMNWGATKSIQEHESGSKKNLLSLWLYVATHPTELKHHIIPYEESSLDDQIAEDKFDKTEHLTAVTRARLLIMSYDRQFRLHGTGNEHNWHKSLNAFIGKFGNKRESFVFFVIKNKDELTPELLKKAGDPPDFKKWYALVSEESNEEILIVDEYNIELTYANRILYNERDLEFYLSEIRRKTNAHPFGDKLPSIKETYVPLSGHCGSSQKDISDLVDYIYHWAIDGADGQHTAVLGEYGQGKSILADHLTEKLLESISEHWHIPILIELGGTSPRTSSPDKIIDSWAARYDIPNEIAKLWIKEGKPIFIFDAFDEMDLVGNSNLRLSNFLTLWKFTSNQNAKIIMTGRPNLFLDTKERDKALKLIDSTSNQNYSKPLYVNKFSLEKIELFLSHWDNRIKEDIVKTAEDKMEAGDNNFIDLISRPSTLYQAAAIWDRLEKDNDGNTLVTTIVRKFLYLNYERELHKREETNGAKPALSIAELAFFMRAIAVAMVHFHGWSNVIERTKLRNMLTRLIEVFPSRLSSFDESISHDLPVERKGISLEKYALDIETKEQIIHEITATGILVEDPSNTTMYRMAHKSFLEYLVSEAICGAHYTKSLESDAETKAINKTLGVNYESLDITSECRTYLSQLIADKGLFNKKPNKRIRTFLYTSISFVTNPFVSVLVPFFYPKLLFNGTKFKKYSFLKFHGLISLHFLLALAPTLIVFPHLLHISSFNISGETSLFYAAILTVYWLFAGYSTMRKPETHLDLLYSVYHLKDLRAFTKKYGINSLSSAVKHSKQADELRAAICRYELIAEGMIPRSWKKQNTPSD